jgi:signal transduction histidine kinase
MVGLDPPTHGEPAGTLGRVSSPRPTWRRLRPAHWIAWAYLATSPLAIVLLALSLVGIVLAPFMVGIPVLALALPATRWLAGLHRQLAQVTLGVPVEGRYAVSPSTAWSSRARTIVRDPQRWRDLAWLAVASTLGLVMAALAVASFLAFVRYLFAPLFVAVVPALGMDVRVFGVDLDTPFGSLLLLPLGVAGLLLWWFGAPLLAQATAVIDRSLLGLRRSQREHALQERVEELVETRSEVVDVQAAELRRIERNLHDGAQARLVASGIALGVGIELLDSDPAHARELLHEALEANRGALADLRDVVRQIHPPVLADRGLVGAIEALAVDMPFDVTLDASLGGPMEAPLESALYFATAECLSNVAKHSHAQRVHIDVARAATAWQVVVRDDGVGGAVLRADGGLAGVARRLAAFDGTLDLASPSGGPTVVRMEVACAS